MTIATDGQHLSKLRLAGMISAHRQGRHQLYFVDDPRTMVREVFEHIAPDDTLATDPPTWGLSPGSAPSAAG